VDDLTPGREGDGRGEEVQARFTRHEGEARAEAAPMSLSRDEGPAGSPRSSATSSAGGARLS
jgi:hypothetical protein